MNYNNARVALNPHLVERMGLDQEGVDRILDFHLDRFEILEVMKELAYRKDYKKLIQYALKHRDNQFELQGAWGFPLDDSYHDWFEVPGCTCPRMDNRERKGTKYQIINMNCPIHTHEDWLAATTTLDGQENNKQLEDLANA